MDVFSFGVVLLELMSGREAIDDEGKVLWAKVGEILEGSEERKVKKLQEWMDDSLLREECTMESVMNVMSVAISCLNKDPSKRPSMVEIVYALSKSIDLFSDISEEGLSPRQVKASTIRKMLFSDYKLRLQNNSHNFLTIVVEKL
uniref:Probable receptor-like protein kinase At1g33260 n=1 Tax=Nicotiana tabacum TaxID=4097 RepID=A0A1S3YR96_TOBAC|nr:PREDICTED: probable receptor-like protein kinase At1g33260 [Nicotiana tabacum]